MKVRTSLASFCLTFISIVAFSQTPATFTTQTYPSGEPTRRAVTADVNNDGILDIVLEPLRGQKFIVLIANGDGSFQAPVTHTLPVVTQSSVPITAADFNNDGKVDLLIENAGTNQMWLYLGNGDGTFKAPLTKTVTLPAGFHFGGEAIAVADFNRDGKVDIVVEANTDTQGGLFVMTGDGAGNFGTPKLVLQPPASSGIGNLVVGDFNADAKADIAALETFDCAPGRCASKVHALLGDGALNFEDTTPFSSSELFAIHAGDVNNDGRTDLFGITTGSLTTPQLYVLYGEPQGTFVHTVTPAPNGQFGFNDEMQLADVNGDGLMDIVGHNGTSATIYLQKDPSDNGQFFTEQVYPLGSNFNFIAPTLIGDFNGDRKPDGAFLAELSSNASGVLYETVNTSTSGTFSADCSYPRNGQGIHLCATPATPNAAAFIASANSFGVLRKMELWVDGKKIGEQFHAWADHRAWFVLPVTSVFPGPGTHNGTMFAVDVDNRLQRLDFTYTISSTSGCPTPSTSTAVSICAPASGSTVTSPVHVSAAGGSAVTFMEVWVDGTKRFQNSGNHVETDLSLGNGSHTMTIYGRNSSGVVGKATETFTVGSGSGTCSQPSSATGTVICSPANGATVTSPVSVQARGGSSVNNMEVWVDGTKRFQTSGNTVTTSLTLAAGSHHITVFGKNGSTVLSKAVSDFTVH